MKNIFNTVKLSGVRSNNFDLGHDVKLSFSMGELVPTCVMECLPGDSFQISTENMLRFAPLISPVMHKVRVQTHYFFVPNRILWPEWEKWITGDTDVEAPYLRLSETQGITVGSLCDYLGLPDGVPTGSLDVNVLPIVAYLKIWNEFYRDQNLQDEISLPVVPGDNSDWLTDYCEGSPLKRAWQHDYFTSALPFAQKGDSVQIPLTSVDDVPVDFVNTGQPGAMIDVQTGAVSGIGPLEQQAGPPPLSRSLHTDDEPSAYDPRGSLVVDIQADATDINTLRRAFRLQEWLERNARAGTRYVETILGHFDTITSDGRLQRPEYLGGARQNMVISEVLATAQSTDDNVAVGMMAGHGISVGGGKSIRYRCEEHGFIIGIINVQPETAYQQGIPRLYSRLDRLDYAWPTFANIGEQEVLNKEVYMQHTTPEGVFGYVPRYAEYKFVNSRVAGEMRTSLAFWHLGRIFASDPALNELFISCNPSTRIFAVTDPDEDHIFAHVFNNVRVSRKLPRYGVPAI